MKEFEKWFKKAEQDLFTINVLLQSDSCPSEICCFHAQQAAEKYLKAYLVSRQIDFPKIHDLVKLVMLCATANSEFKKIEEVASQLTDYAITPRYPDDMHEPTLGDAKQAYQNAIAMKEFVLHHFFE